MVLGTSRGPRSPTTPAWVPNVIACPICGGETSVSETRATFGATCLRRRRRCVKLACTGRITTIEVPVPHTFGINRRVSTGVKAPENWVVIPRHKLEALSRAAAELAVTPGIGQVQLSEDVGTEDRVEPKEPDAE